MKLHIEIAKLIDKWLPAKLFTEHERILANQMIFSLCEQYANQSKWISVEDSLPEHDNNVLAILNGNMEIMAYCNIHEDGETFKVWHIVYDGLQGDPIYDDNYEPTHWQPLPKRN